MEDKENILNTFSTDADNLGVVQAKYEVKTSNCIEGIIQHFWEIYIFSFRETVTSDNMTNVKYISAFHP